MSEVRLINADKLIRQLEICKANANPLDCSTRAIYAECITMIKYAETIDAEPVRHGRWVEQWDYDYMQYLHFCGECGKYPLTKEETMHDEVLSSYCPHCGAKMDKEK